MFEHGSAQPLDPGNPQLRGFAFELYDDLRLMPLLRRLVRTSCQLTSAMGGSISIVDIPQERYIKVAEHGAACRLGQSFPLDEGVTGQVVAHRRPVVLARYRDVATGHLPDEHPAWNRAVAGIPIWWRGDVIAVHVVFARGGHRFAGDEVDQLEVLTHLVAPGLVTAVQRDLPLRRAPSKPLPAGEKRLEVASTTGLEASAATCASVADVARGLVSVAERAAVRRRASTSWLHVTVAPHDEGLRMIVQEDGPGTRGACGAGAGRWSELVDRPGGSVGAAPVTDGASAAAVQLEIPPRPPSGRAPQLSPFTRREQQVATLVARGLSDRAVAEQLVISPKTVEKHVGAVLRKTGTTGRTAAIVSALAQGWLVDGAGLDT